jgi:TPP-dependent indolepyruvate ferredoxin oxidoreductase alpha subunit
MAEFAQGLEEILVIEEKAPVVERQIKDQLYGLPDLQRPRIAGKTTPHGEPLLSSLGELRPSRIMEVVADWLARLNPALDRTPPGHRLHDALPAAQRRRRRRSASRTSARAARTTRPRRCPKARARWPASAAISWPAGWSARPAA